MNPLVEKEEKTYSNLKHQRNKVIKKSISGSINSKKDSQLAFVFIFLFLALDAFLFICSSLQNSDAIDADARIIQVNRVPFIDIPYLAFGW